MGRLYDTAAWERARQQALHDAGWKCSNPKCGRSLIGLGKEAHVHHRKALRRAPALGLERLNLRPYCRDCHMQIEAGERKPSMVSVDGTPTDPAHPWSRPGELSELLSPTRGERDTDDPCYSERWSRRIRISRGEGAAARNFASS